MLHQSDDTDNKDGWVKSDHKMSPDAVLMDQYKVYVDLFKFYVDCALKATTWFYAITGSILTYYFSHEHKPSQLLPYSLVLPIVLSVGFAIIFLTGRTHLKDMGVKLDHIRGELKLPGTPHIQFLMLFLTLCGTLYICVGLAITVLLIHDLFKLH